MGTVDELREVYRKAIEEIENRGWCQGSLSNLDGNVCAMGAISCAVYGKLRLIESEVSEVYEVYEVSEVSYNKFNKAVEYLSDLYLPSDFLSIASYNDHEATSKEDIILMLKRAANDD